MGDASNNKRPLDATSFRDGFDEVSVSAEPKLEDSSDESESGDDVDQSQDVKVLLTQTLTKISNKELDLSDNSKLNTLGKALAQHTKDDYEPTALHLIARGGTPEFRNLDKRAEPLVRFLCKENEYLNIKDRSGHTSLFLAIEKKRKEMVEWLCDAHPDIGSIISIKGSKGMNCLHIGVKKRIIFLDLLIKHATPEACAAKDDEGNTPLHLAVDYKNCKRKQLEYVRQLVEKGDPAIKGTTDGDFNNNGLSPYLFHKESVKKRLNKATAKRSRETQKSGKATDTASKPVLSSQAAGIVSPPDNIQVDNRGKFGERNTKQSSAPTSSQAIDPTIGTGSSVNKMNITNGSSMLNKNSKDGKGSDAVDETIVKDVEHLLKLHYLRSRSNADATEILYGKNSTLNKELFFDLSGDMDSDGVLTQSQLESFNKLDFEDTLQYVFIPHIPVEGPRSARQALHVARPVSHEGGRWDYNYIFRFLEKKGVKAILRIHVDDMHPKKQPHSDEAIEDALEGRGVEVWDWKKPDLCSEVIFKAAQTVRKVHLYWNGNNAVLRGWSEPEGFPKFPELQEIFLHVSRGLESDARNRRNIANFTERMRSRCPKIKVNLSPSNKRQRITDGSRLHYEETQTDPVRHQWIECMKDFRGFLLNAEREYPGWESGDYLAEPIVVALLDDGVARRDLDYQSIAGTSFCVRSEDPPFVDPHYQSRSGHGTTMADKIQGICPHVKFLVLRLEDCQSDDGTTKLNITARSAAKAIRVAISWKVHIISMSWTIDISNDDKHKRDLEEAIGAAARADILMFCSAKDKGADDTATYPSQATKKIFTIGAAKASGTTAGYAGNTGNLDYIFPGDKVPAIIGRNATNSHKTVDGSSVATALASGLAALILYCIQVQICLADGHQKRKAQEAFSKAKRYDGMKKALSHFGTTTESSNKFLKVWEVFRPVVQKKPEGSPDLWLELVAELGSAFCSKIG